MKRIAVIGITVIIVLMMVGCTTKSAEDTATTAYRIDAETKYFVTEMCNKVYVIYKTGDSSSELVEEYVQYYNLSTGEKGSVALSAGLEVDPEEKLLYSDDESCILYYQIYVDKEGHVWVDK